MKLVHRGLSTCTLHQSASFLSRSISAAPVTETNRSVAIIAIICRRYVVHHGLDKGVRLANNFLFLGVDGDRLAGSLLHDGIRHPDFHSLVFEDGEEPEGKGGVDHGRSRGRWSGTCGEVCQEPG